MSTLILCAKNTRSCPAQSTKLNWDCSHTFLQPFQEKNCDLSRVTFDEGKVFYTKKCEGSNQDLSRKSRLNEAGIDPLHFETILKYYQGEEIQIDVNESLLEFIKTCQVLSIGSLIDSVKKQLLFRFDDFDFFVLFSLSLRNSFSSLGKRCLQELTKYEFEQMNFNRYELLQCDQCTFKEVIRCYEEFKCRNTRKGPSRVQVRRIVQQYCDLHEVQIKWETICQKNLQKIDEVSQLEQQKQDQPQLLKQIPYCYPHPIYHYEIL